MREHEPSNAFVRFFAKESAGGVLLGLAALAALIVSHSPLAAWYQGFMALPGAVVVGDLLRIEKPLVVGVNDLWMAAFFFLVGLEIKREFVEGELSARSQAVLPALAALGGMAVPAAIYAAINWGDAAALRGIGFTMSLFIGGLAFGAVGPDWETQVKLGVMAGSLVAGVAGSLVLWRASAGR